MNHKTTRILLFVSLIVWIKSNPISIIITVSESESNSLYLTHSLENLDLILSDSKTNIDVLIAPIGVNYQRDDGLELLEAKYPNFRFLNGKRDDCLPCALNRAVGTAKGDYFIIMNEKVVLQSLNDVSNMLDELENEGVGAVSVKMVQEDMNLYHAGIFFKYTGSAQSDDYWARDKIEVPWLFFRLQGYNYMDGRSMESTFVDSVPKALFAISKDNLMSIGGFNEEYKNHFFEADLSLKLSEMELSVVYTPFSVAKLSDFDYPSDEYFPSQENDEFKQDRNTFISNWDSTVHDIIYSRYEIQNLTLTWNMECGTGQVLGFTSEAIGYLTSMHDKIRLTAKVTTPNDCKAEVKKAGYPLEIRKLISSLIDLEEVVVDQPIMLVIHRDPGRYSYFIPSSAVANSPSVVIGRSMYETDRIPNNWVEPCNTLVDRLWVPSSFNLETFTQAGVNSSLLDKLPESVDIMHYDPTIVKPLKSIRESDQFIFLSVMKWESRKAWKVLLRAYFEVFLDNKQVKLVVISRMDGESKRLYEEFLNDYLKDHQLHINQLPKVQVFSEFIPYTKLPSVYASADAFLLPSHGEGWGLPLMEAMAMELPTVGTAWSGNTEFMHGDNSFLIAVAGMEEANSNGHQWATPDLDSLKEHMLYIFDNYDESKAIARKARKDIMLLYSREATGERLSNMIKPFNNPEMLASMKEARQSRNLQNSGNYQYNNNYNNNNYNSYSNSNINQNRQLGKFEDENGKERYRIKFID